MGDIDAVFSERHADRLQIEQFVQALFRYADSNTYVSLRAFDQQDSTAPAFLIQPVQVNGDLAHIVTEATAAAERCLQAPRGIVFAPPICTFNNALRGRTQDLANGLALSIELDEGNTLAALERLTALIGQPTEVVASGSDWMDPATGELFPKLHIHWRLSEPTRTEADHATLARVRDLAARLAGADPTGKPVVHPLRWPGSWNRKGEAAGREPRLARILSGSPDAEIHLVEVAEIVAEAVESAGGDGKDLPASSTPEANEALLTDAFATIPNPGRTVHYDEWMRFGYAAYRAFGGSEAGREAWDAWAAKSEKYDAREQDAAWRRIGNAIRGGTAVRTVGAGTIFFHATAAGWVRPALRLFEARAVPDPDEPATPSSKPELTLAKPELTLAFGRNALIPPPLATIVSELLYAGSLTLIYGPPKSGKSFLATDLALAVAAGKESWMGHSIRRPCDVLYVACEGHGGFWKRLTAADRERSAHPDGFILATGHPMLLKAADRGGYFFVPDPSSILIALESCRAAGRDPRVVIIDTVFRSFGVGNVNASQDMNAYLAAIGVLTNQSLAVAAVHHQNKASVSPSGSVSLTGGADTVIHVWRDGPDDNKGQRYWQIEMAKDGDETDPRAFTLQVIDVGVDADGEPATSCIVIDNGIQETQTKRGRPRTDNSETAVLSRLIYRCLTDMLADPTKPVTKVRQSGVVFYSCQRNDLRAYVNSAGFYVSPPEDATEKDRKRLKNRSDQAYARAVNMLIDQRKVFIHKDMIGISSSTDNKSTDVS